MLKRYTVSDKCDLKKFKGDKKLIKPLVFRLISIKKDTQKSRSSRGSTFQKILWLKIATHIMSFCSKRSVSALIEKIGFECSVHILTHKTFWTEELT